MVISWQLSHPPNPTFILQKAQLLHHFKGNLLKALNSTFPELHLDCPKLGNWQRSDCERISYLHFYLQPSAERKRTISTCERRRTAVRSSPRIRKKKDSTLLN